MNLDFSPEDLAFRDEVRAFIADNYPERLREFGGDRENLTKEDMLSWHRTLAKKGWVAPSWPKQYGGGEAEDRRRARPIPRGSIMRHAGIDELDAPAGRDLGAGVARQRGEELGKA